MTRFIGIMGVVLLLGCAQKKPVAVVPLKCMHHIEITDFIGPCIPSRTDPNRAVCHVVIHYDCIAPLPQHP